MIKQCSKCKNTKAIDEFYVNQRWCKFCAREYRLINKDKENAKHREWYWENHEKRLKQNNQSYWRNREVIRLQRKQWSLKNRELISKRWKKWAKENKDYLKAKKAERKARINQNGGSFTRQEWIILKEKYNNQCLSCYRKEPEIELTPDHIVPLIKGGTSNLENIQPLCRNCNCSKRAEIIDYREGGFYGFPI